MGGGNAHEMGKPFLNQVTLAQALWQWYRHKGPTPWIAVLYIQCKAWSSLPFVGGVADQPFDILDLLSLVPKVERYERLSVKEQAKLPKPERIYLDRISGRNKLPENKQWA